MDNNQILLKKILFSKYQIISLIGKGVLTDVYMAKSLKTGKLYAAKVEERLKSIGSLEKEAYFLYILKGFGVPEIITYGRSGEYNILIQQLLGESLTQLFKKSKNRIKDLCMAAIQIIDRLKFIHSKFIVHRDIKPDNFLVGNPDFSTIYIIDFNLSRKYRSSRTGKHINFFINKTNPGTIDYLSLNVTSGIEPTRRDDLESMAYMLIFLSKGVLPWSNVRGKNINEIAYKIYKIKKYISLEKLCEDLPNEIILFIKYVKLLKFDETPNYTYLQNLFFTILKNMNQENDLNFSWMNEKDRTILRNKAKSPNFPKNLNNSNKSNSKSRLISRIKNSLINHHNFDKKNNNSMNLFSTNFVQDIKPKNNFIISNNIKNNIQKTNLNVYHYKSISDDNTLTSGIESPKNNDESINGNQIYPFQNLQIMSASQFNYQINKSKSNFNKQKKLRPINIRKECNYKKIIPIKRNENHKKINLTTKDYNYNSAKISSRKKYIPLIKRRKCLPKTNQTINKTSDYSNPLENKCLSMKKFTTHISKLPNNNSISIYGNISINKQPTSIFDPKNLNKLKNSFFRTNISARNYNISGQINKKMTYQRKIKPETSYEGLSQRFKVIRKRNNSNILGDISSTPNNNFYINYCQNISNNAQMIQFNNFNL